MNETGYCGIDKSKNCENKKLSHNFENKLDLEVASDHFNLELFYMIFSSKKGEVVGKFAPLIKIIN